MGKLSNWKMATPPVPPDLSTCDLCRRPVPPTTSPEFATWVVVKNDSGRVSGMRCPHCQVTGGPGGGAVGGGA